MAGQQWIAGAVQAAESSEHTEVQNPTHNHVRAVVKLLKQGTIKREDLTHLDIYHEDCCGLLTRRGLCDCTPEIVVNPIH